MTGGKRGMPARVETRRRDAVRRSTLSPSWAAEAARFEISRARLETLNPVS